MTITRHPDTPNITVAPGDMAVVGYSITYPAQCTDVHLQLEYSASGRSRKVDDTYCSHSDLYNANVGAASDCPSTDGLKTDWYVLRINGTEDIDGQMVKCVLLKNNLDEVDPNCNSTCEELAIIVTNGKELLLCPCNKLEQTSAHYSLAMSPGLSHRNCLGYQRGGWSW